MIPDAAETDALELQDRNQDESHQHSDQKPLGDSRSRRPRVTSTEGGNLTAHVYSVKTKVGFCHRPGPNNTPFLVRRGNCFCYCFLANLFLRYRSTLFVEFVGAVDFFFASIFPLGETFAAKDKTSSAQQGRSGRPASRRSSRSITSLQQHCLKNAEDL